MRNEKEKIQELEQLCKINNMKADTILVSVKDTEEFKRILAENKELKELLDLSISIQHNFLPHDFDDRVKKVLSSFYNERNKQYKPVSKL